MKNKDVAELLTRMGLLLDIRGEMVFKVRAYFKSAENIENLTEDIDTVRRENRLSDIPGIGKTLEEKITEYLDTGRMSAHEKLIQEIPESILDVIHIPSVGPKKAKLFFDQLKIKDIEGLKKAAEQGKLLGLPGIKEKTIENILKGIGLVRQGQERMDIGGATETADKIVEQLRKLREVKDIAVGGSLRRMKETIRDIDILIDSSKPQKVMEAFVNLPQVASINAYGDTKSSIMTHQNVQVDLRVVDPKSFGAALLYFTGSKNFNVKLRQIAKDKGMKVNEYGVFSMQGEKEKRLASRTEKECFEALALPYVPPELREDIGESALFSGNKILKVPQLLKAGDIKGDLHVHSTWSDGLNSIEDMVEAARRKGYEYLAICDHSLRLKVAGGLSPEDLKKKRAEIDKLNKKHKDFRILYGTEVEIDMEGNLDYNDKILSDFDMVVAAIHTGFEQNRTKQTQRIINACRNKNVHIIAHPTGMHLGKREPCDIDLKEICRVAVDTNTFLEINAFPIRLDLNSANVYFARNQGAKFAINTDAHSTQHLDFMTFGVAVARRGWAGKKDVLNTLPAEKLLKTIKK